MKETKNFPNRSSKGEPRGKFYRSPKENKTD